MRVGRHTKKSRLSKRGIWKTRNRISPPETVIRYVGMCQYNKMPHTPGEVGMQDMKLIASIYEAVSYRDEQSNSPEITRFRRNSRESLDASSNYGQTEVATTSSCVLRTLKIFFQSTQWTLVYFVAATQLPTHYCYYNRENHETKETIVISLVRPF